MIDFDVKYCPVCGSSHIKSYEENEANGYFHEWYTVKCKDCGNEFRIEDGYFDDSIYKYRRE